MGNKQPINKQPIKEITHKPIEKSQETLDAEILFTWLNRSLRGYSLITEKFLERNWSIISINSILMHRLSRDFEYYSLSEEFLGRHIDSFWDSFWDWKLLSKNISLEFVEKHPELNWDWNLLTSNKKINEKFLEKFTDKPLNWFSISEYNNNVVIGRSTLIRGGVITEPSFSISIDFIRKYSHLDWDWKTVSLRRDITVEDLTRFSGKPLDWKKISERTDLTTEFIHSFQEKLEMNDNISNILDKFIEKQEKARIIKGKLSKAAELMGIVENTFEIPSAPREPKETEAGEIEGM